MCAEPEKLPPSNLRGLDCLKTRSWKWKMKAVRRDTGDAMLIFKGSNPALSFSLPHIL